MSMLPLLCVLQLAATVPLAPTPPDSEIPRPSLIAAFNPGQFETFTPVLPLPRLPLLEASTMGEASVAVDTPRTVAIEYSDRYYKLLTIHKYASYATIPLFVLQSVSGQKLMKDPGQHSWARDVHGPVAAGIGVLFGVNTVTGLWNLYDSRKDPNGRTRRTVHSLLMLAADAGFVWAGAIAPGKDEPAGSARANRHRAVAIGSGSVALVSYLMMLVWKD
jgi:hypothetical protein